MRNRNCDGGGGEVKFGKKLKILIPAEIIEDVKLSMLSYQGMKVWNCIYPKYAGNISP